MINKGLYLIENLLQILNLLNNKTEKEKYHNKNFVF